MIGAYYRLTKPGIIYGNLYTVLAGYLFASQLEISWPVLAAAMLGMALVIAGGCVFNNVLDRDIDAKMERTRTRATVTGAISVPQATAFGSLLALFGLTTLYLWVNPLTALVALTGLFFYVVVYGYAKRVTRTHTLIGSIAGAVPITAGYTAAMNALDTAAVLLFFILVLWQMPHFYAIAMYRLREYAAAGIPLLPVAVGARTTKIIIAVYIAAFVVAESLLTLLGYTGYTYLAVVLGFGSAWFVRAMRGFTAANDELWAKQLFFFSITVLLAFCAGISFGGLVP